MSLWRRLLARILGVLRGRCLTPGCLGDPILVYWQVVPNPVTGRPVRQETWHCPECMLVFTKARPTKQRSGSWKLDVRERLKRLGYL